MDKKVLEHVGIKGMRWGIRKAQTSSGSSSSKNSADHDLLKKAKGKSIKDLSDDEIRSVVKRIKLISQYRNSSFIKQGKINKLSNAELEAGINKNKLKTTVLRKNPFTGVTKLSAIGKMDDKEVKRILDRIELEASYKKLSGRDYKAVEKLVTALLLESLTKTIQSAKANR